MKKQQDLFIVEDDPLFASILKTNLTQKTDYKIHIFETGEAMLNALYMNPAVVLLDYYLEEMNGLDVLRQIRGFNPNITVIFISAQETTQVAVDSLKNGALDYIVKDETSVDKIMVLLDKKKAVDMEVEKLQRSRRNTRFILAGVIVIAIVTIFICF